MPTYIYRCANCGYSFEQFQRISAEPIRICPTCGQEQVQRVLTGGSGLIFKGSGFYATDYKKSSITGDSKPEKKSNEADKKT